jgi:hypothetical protein
MIPNPHTKRCEVVRLMDHTYTVQSLDCLSRLKGKKKECVLAVYRVLHHKQNYSMDMDEHFSCVDMLKETMEEEEHDDEDYKDDFLETYDDNGLFEQYQIEVQRPMLTREDFVKLTKGTRFSKYVYFYDHQSTIISVELRGDDLYGSSEPFDMEMVMYSFVWSFYDQVADYRDAAISEQMGEVGSSELCCTINSYKANRKFFNLTEKLQVDVTK